MPIHPREHPALVRVANLHRKAVPRVPPADGRPRSPKRLDVFAVGIDWAQITWSRLGPGPVRVRCGDQSTEIFADGGPGSHLVHGLTDGSAHQIRLDGDAMAGKPQTLTAETLTRPPGEELFRFATVSDAHIGSIATGYLHLIAEIPAPLVPHPVRCLRWAVSEAKHWGAQRLVVKGDLVEESNEEHWTTAGDVLAVLRTPVDVIRGNHEAKTRGEIDAAVGATSIGLDLVDGVRTIDQDGVRLLLADSTRPDKEVGDLRHGDEILEGAAATDQPVFVAVHHQLMRFPVPTYLPLGIPQPSSRHFLRSLGDANARSLVSSGHTHRHRRYDVGPVTVTEVGSTKDFPGTWAGYQYFEGGVVQTVRRTGEPSVIRWTDHTRRAAAGVWALWSPGPLSSRCFSRMW